MTTGATASAREEARIRTAHGLLTSVDLEETLTVNDYLSTSIFIAAESLFVTKYRSLSFTFSDRSLSRRLIFMIYIFLISLSCLKNVSAQSSERSFAARLMTFMVLFCSRDSMIARMTLLPIELKLRLILLHRLFLTMNFARSPHEADDMRFIDMFKSARVGEPLKLVRIHPPALSPSSLAETSRQSKEVFVDSSSANSQPAS